MKPEAPAAVAVLTGEQSSDAVKVAVPACCIQLLYVINHLEKARLPYAIQAVPVRHYRLEILFLQ